MSDRNQKNSGPSQEKNFARLRQKMVDSQLIKRGITDTRVIRAMRQVPRHLFVPPEFRHLSYDDTPLPLEHEQTISQPYIVALMSQEIDIEPHHRVLEIGTGSGYQTAVLSQLASEVYTIEIIPQLFYVAKERLALLGYDNIFCNFGDGTLGWQDRAPFDRIIITAAPGTIPPRLLSQLTVLGKMILPLGEFDQHLVTLVKKADGSIERIEGARVRFVPMTGIAEKMN